MKRHTLIRRTLGLGLGLVLFAPATWADASPEAEPWIEKLISLYDQGAFTTSYVANLSMQQGGQSVEGVVDGKIAWGDREHMRVDMTISMKGMLPGAGDQPTEMSVLSITDGELTWTDVQIPAMGVRQVMKISIEQAKAMAEQQGAALGANPASMDPVQQLENLAKTLDFEVLEVKDGKVHLSAAVKPEHRSQLGQLGSMPGTDRMELVLHEATGHPAAITIGGETPLVTMQFGEFEPTTLEKLGEGAFSYTPPEGVQVMDLGAMANPANPVR